MWFGLARQPELPDLDERCAMKRTRSRVERRARQKFNSGLQIISVEDGLIFEHRNASHFVAEINLRAEKISVPVTATFSDHPDYDEDEIVEHAMEELRPRLRRYRERGYRIRETEFQPAQVDNQYREGSVPIFIAFVQRDLEGEEDLYNELDWLLEQLPAK